MEASATGWSNAGWSLKAPRFPDLSRVDFHAVVVALPLASQPPTTRSPSVSATAEAPLRGSGSLRFLTAFQLPSEPDSGSRPSDQTVSVAFPSGPRPPIR